MDWVRFLTDHRERNIPEFNKALADVSRTWKIAISSVNDNVGQDICSVLIILSEIFFILGNWR